jgi:hypothetical protein
MANGFDIKIDMSDFRAAIRDFAEFDRRTLPEIVTAKLGDLAWESAKVVRRTTRATVESFRDNPIKFWRYIEKVYATTGMGIAKRRKARGFFEKHIPYKDASTGKIQFTRTWIHEKRTIGAQNARTSLKDYGKKWNELKMIATRIMRRRAGRVAHLPGLFLKAAHMLGKNVRSTDVGKNAWKTLGVDAAKAVPGWTGRCRAFFTLPIRAYLRETGEGNRSEREAGKLGFAEAALNSVKAKIVADMRQKTQERYDRKIAQMNARKAARMARLSGENVTA